MFSVVLTDDQENLRLLAAELTDRHVRPAADGGDRASGVLQRLHAAGVVGAVSEESGGQGQLTNLETVVVAEELAAGDPGIAWAALAGGWVLSTIDAIGGPGHRASLRPIVSNPGWLAAPLVMEGFGRSPQEFRAHAQGGRGNWSLRGAKDPVVNGVAAGIGLAIANVEDTVVLGAFLLDAGALAACEILRDDMAVGTLGLRAARTARLDLAGVAVNENCLLGWGEEVGRAVAAFRLASVAVVVGLIRAAIDHATNFGKERVAFGSRIGDVQSLGVPLADLAAELEVTRRALWEAAVSLDNGVGAESSPLVEGALARAGRLAPWAVREAMQFLGGQSFLTDRLLERLYGDAAVLCAGDPGLSSPRSHLI
jgi:alkylation response protein AidB-like acyl-CoA dehydrogenase